MEENNNSFRSFMNAFIPLLIYGLISLVVETGYYVYIIMSSFSVEEVATLSSEDMLKVMEAEYEMIAPYVIITVAFICIPMFIWLYSKDKKDEIKHSLKLNYTVMIAVMGILSCVCFSNFIVALKLSGSDSGTNNLKGIPILIFLATSICSPILEELLFRGIVFARFRRMGVKYVSATLGVSVIFALMHSNISQAAYAFLVSLFFCYLYEKTENVIGPIIMHLSANIFAFCSNYFGLLDGIYTTNKMIYFFVNCVIFACLALIGKAFEIKINEERFREN